MNNSFVTWDDIFNADYPDVHLRNTVSVSVAQKMYEMEEEQNNAF